MLLQMVFGNSPEKISLVIFIPTLKPNALGLRGMIWVRVSVAIMVGLLLELGYGHGQHYPISQP